MAESVMLGMDTGKIKNSSPKEPQDKKKLLVPIAIAAGVFVLVIAIALLMLFGGSSQAEESETSEAVTELIEAYEEAGVEITEDDIEITVDEETGEETANVKEEVVADTAITVSTSALNAINDLFSGQDGGTYSYKSSAMLGTSTTVNTKYYGDETTESAWDDVTGSFNNQNANSDGKDSWTAIEDITGGDDVVDLDDVLDYINNQLDYIKFFIDKNTDFYQNGPYDLVTQEVLEAAWSGDLSGTYSDMSDYTHSTVFSAMLAHMYTRMIMGDTTAVWDNSTLIGMIESGSSGTNVLYNIVSNKVYESQLTRIDYVVEDTSLSRTYLGTTVTSAYMALCNGYKVYLDYDLTIIDIA